jgi:hypothetical protein
MPNEWGANDRRASIFAKPVALHGQGDDETQKEIDAPQQKQVGR